MTSFLCKFVSFSDDMFTYDHIFSASDSNQSEVYIMKQYHGYETLDMYDQCLSQDLETGYLKLAVAKFWRVQIFNGDHNILIFQP